MKAANLAVRKRVRLLKAGDPDLAGIPIPPKGVIRRIFRHPGYKTPWVEIEGVSGQFQPKELAELPAPRHPDYYAMARRDAGLRRTPEGWE